MKSAVIPENRKVAVNESLAEYVHRREQFKITELFGKVDFDESFNYKEQRKIPWGYSSILLN